MKIFSTIIIVITSLLFSKYPDAIGRNGAVSSTSQYATEVGIEILKDGGTAIDAAIAVGFALSVTHPGAGNLGGGGFMVIRFADGTVTTIDFRETAPALAYRDMFLDDSLNVIPGKSWMTSWASGVPGSVAGFGYVHENYGSKKWKELVSPSIKLAKSGFPLDYLNVLTLNGYKSYLALDEISRNIFLNENDWKLGDIFKQPDLAKTLKRISKKGFREFYEGKTATMILDCMKRTDGLISPEDLLNYSVIERSPIEFDYRGYTVYSMPPVSSGGIALAQILNQLENVEFGEFPFHSAQHIHFVVEAEKRAFADRSYFLGDPKFVQISQDTLISQTYADFRWTSVDTLLSTNSSEIGYGEFPIIIKESDETTHYSIVDKWGNAVSTTVTLNGWYGSGITVDGAGFLLNNEMDDFSSKPGQPNTYGLIGDQANSIQPNKRMLSSMTPTIVENLNGELLMVVGAAGGSKIITTVAQIISNVIDFEMNIDEAVETPRFHHQWLPDLLFVESAGFSQETINLLSSRSYTIDMMRGTAEANCIYYDSERKLVMGSGDSRRGANAQAY